MLHCHLSPLTTQPSTLQLTAALSHKEKGNAAYKAGRLVRAQRQYSTAVELASSIAQRDLAPNPTTPEAAAEGGVSTAHIMAQVRGEG